MFTKKYFGSTNTETHIQTLGIYCINRKLNTVSAGVFGSISGGGLLYQYRPQFPSWTQKCTWKCSFQQPVYLNEKKKMTAKHRKIEKTKQWLLALASELRLNSLCCY